MVVSPAGPMTRSELELVQGLGDPLTLPDLLPARPVEKGQSWKLPGSAVFALTEYDAVKSTSLEATLEELDEDGARIKIKGEVQGSRTGASADRVRGIRAFRPPSGPGRSARAQPDGESSGRSGGGRPRGQEHGRRSADEPRILAPELSDDAILKAPLDTSPLRQLLQLISPDGKYNVLHDRRWHTYWDDPKLIVLKRLEKGQVVAQCNLTAGPPAGKGKHQDLNQFRDDVRKSLGQRFVQFLGAGEVDGDPAGGFRYKLAVQGREGDLGVLWYYYLLASPEGDQLLATFTLAEEEAKAFGDQDLEIIGSLQWTRPAAESR